MAKVHEKITREIGEFIRRQHMFFVATAPLSKDGHVNLSPKGLDCFRILGPQQVGYMDLVGSGNETAAHVLENGRITFMFCAFEGPPNILRLYGTGRVVLPEADEWPALAQVFPIVPSARQIIVAEIERVQTSCGFGVPEYTYAGERDMHFKWASKKSAVDLAEYQEQHNAHSIDGLPTPLCAGL
jgi:hypothetical protein